MFDYLYEWICNIAYYVVLMTAVIQVIPNNDYKKYIRFFSGMILIMLLLTPVLKVLGMEQTLTEIYKGRDYELRVQEIEKSTQYLDEINISDYLPDYGDEELELEKKEDAIVVEEVQIG